MPSYAHAATQHRRYDSFRHRSRLHRAFQEQLHGFLRPDCSLRSDSQPAPPNRNPIDLTASAANASGSVQTTLSKLPRPHRPVIPTLLLRGSPDRDLSFPDIYPALTAEIILNERACPSELESPRQARNGSLFLASVGVQLWANREDDLSNLVSLMLLPQGFKRTRASSRQLIFPSVTSAANVFNPCVVTLVLTRPHPIVHCSPPRFDRRAQKAWISKRLAKSITAQVTP